MRVRWGHHLPCDTDAFPSIPRPSSHAHHDAVNYVSVVCGLDGKLRTNMGCSVCRPKFGGCDQPGTTCSRSQITLRRVHRGRTAKALRAEQCHANTHAHEFVTVSQISAGKRFCFLFLSDARGGCVRLSLILRGTFGATGTAAVG